MSKTRKWPTRALYLMIALALVISLVGIALVPSAINADPGVTKWSKVTTPSQTNLTIVPGSDIYDFAVGGAKGEVIYAIGEVPTGNLVGARTGELKDVSIALWKSTDGGATWTDQTDKLLRANVKLDLPAEFATLTQVAVAPDDEKFVVVAGTLTTGAPAVVGSTDGATKFSYTGDMSIGGAINPGRILCLDVSRKVEDVRNIAVGTDTGYVLRYEAGGLWGSHWVNAVDPVSYPGWVASNAVTSIAFSPSWSADKTVLAISIKADSTVWLQSGMWGTRKGWGSGVERASAVQIKEEAIAVKAAAVFPGVTGMAVPSDYQGDTSSLRRVYVYVDAVGMAPKADGGYLFRIDSTTLSSACGPSGNPWLASIAYYGTYDTGDIMLGMLGEGAPTWGPALTACCAGVEVYRTAEVDICCPQWTKASKKPSGQAYALVAFTPDGKKAYATTMDGGLAGESAFSVSLDKGKCWNQLGLIDTDIDYLSDVAVSPDCSVTYLSSINVLEADEVCGCDSVWMKNSNATDYAGVWQRVYHKSLGDDCGLLRLSPAHDDGDLVYWGDYGTQNLYWASGKGICAWSTRTTTINVQDFALADDDTLYVINNGTDIVKWTKATRDWTSAVDHKAVSGHTVAVLGDNILVGGGAGSVSYSKDAAATFTRLGEKGELGGQVHVAFDSKFSSNNTIYAAVTGGKQGIWRWVIDTSTSWKDLSANPSLNLMGGSGAAALTVDYYGIVLGRSDGTLYATYLYTDGTNWYTGVARCLSPAETPCCGINVWDYLHAGLKVKAVADDIIPASGISPQLSAQQFDLQPRNLVICGCLTADSTSKLFAIDDDPYAMADGKDGTVWTYEDCLAKVGVVLKSPADGYTVPIDPCQCCNSPFTIAWDRECNACVYQIEIKSADKTAAVFTGYAAGTTADLKDVNGADLANGKVMADAANPTYLVPGGQGQAPLSPGQTYYWRVRVIKAESGEFIKSPWSPYRSLIVEAAAATVELSAPEYGATDVAVANVGFAWKAVKDADSYDFVLSKNADLSSPVESKTGIKGTAYSCTTTLDYGTTYFWQVTAKKGANVLAKSSAGSFTTVEKPKYCAPDGLCFDNEAALKAHLDQLAAPAPTPTWVWIVIGLGAVLVIVVVVLIFRTRRV